MSLTKSNIEWCTHSWNPIVGCWGPGGTQQQPKRCWYCYAEDFATGPRRLLQCPKCHTFEPHFHEERLYIPNGKPKTIFFGSMCDAWGDWVPREWINECLELMREHEIQGRPGWDYYNTRHRFLTLTKNPKRYLEFADMLPENLWCGVTMTGSIKDHIARYRPMRPWRDIPTQKIIYPKTNKQFLSLEPLLSDPFEYRMIRWKESIETKYDWLIIGPLNKRGHPPVTKREWVERIVDIAQAAGVPVFLKDNLWKLGVMPKDEVKALQQFPW